VHIADDEAGVAMGEDAVRLSLPGGWRDDGVGCRTPPGGAGGRGAGPGAPRAGARAGRRASFPMSSTPPTGAGEEGA
jgi:hypothetical protein